jgi:inner membrane protein
VVLAASHGPMDMLTNGGLGIALLAPFDGQRYFWDWRPILVSPIGLKNFLSPWGLAVVLNELRWFGPPLGLLVAFTLFRRYRARKA